MSWSSLRAGGMEGRDEWTAGREGWVDGRQAGRDGWVDRREGGWIGGRQAGMGGWVYRREGRGREELHKDVSNLAHDSKVLGLCFRLVAIQQ